jgi:LysR family hydrogen peroxide-inducible transcriptional activator
MEVTLRQLKYLISLADEGHFGRAAAAVNVSQPALSVQIRDLEARLGVRLVERRARRVALTPAGREVLRRARRVEAEVRELQDAARRERGLGGRLRLGVIPTVAPYLLPVALPLLRGRNIALDLGVREAQTQTLVDELAAGELDAVLLALPAPAPDLAVTPLFEDRFLLAGSRAQIDGLRDTPPRPEAMAPERLLLLEDGHCLADQSLAACGLAREATRVDMRASSLATLCRLVEEGFGLTLLPELAVRAETAAAPGLALLRFDAPEPLRTIGLARRRLASDEGWFDELADILRAAGRAVLDQSPVAAATWAAAPSVVTR